MVPKEYPAQQPKTNQVKAVLNKTAQAKADEEKEERDDLAHQRQRDQGQGRGKPGRNRLKINDLVFWGDKFTLLGLMHLVDVTVIARDQADDLIRLAGGLHGGKCSLVGGSTLILHGHLGTHDAVRILVLGFFERVQELTGTLDGFGTGGRCQSQRQAALYMGVLAQGGGCSCPGCLSWHMAGIFRRGRVL